MELLFSSSKFIDAYKMVDGRDINTSSGLYSYLEEGFTSKDYAFSGYTIKPNVSLMYMNREPRFYASIGYSGCLWPMNSTTETGKYMVQIFFIQLTVTQEEVRPLKVMSETIPSPAMYLKKIYSSGRCLEWCECRRTQ